MKLEERELFLDLHFHSRYSRVVSSQLNGTLGKSFLGKKKGLIFLGIRRLLVIFM